MSTVVIDTFDDPVTLDPHRAQETGSQHAVLNVYDGLLGFDRTGRLRPVLAAELPATTDRGGEPHLLLPIREGVRFHDGSRFTVEDAVYSLRRVAVTASVPAALWSDALLGMPVAKLSAEAALDMAARITATEDGLLLRLARPYGPLQALLAQWSCVVHRGWCAERGAWDGELATLGAHLLPGATALDGRANGTGQYRLDEWDRERRELRYHKVVRDFVGAEPGPDVILLRSVDDSAQRERELTEGTADFSVCLTESRARLSQSPGVVVEEVTEVRSINPIAFITQKLDPDSYAVGSGEFAPDGIPPNAFSDVHLRRMISLCFDHQTYATEVLDGAAMPHAVPFPAPMVPGITPSWPVTDLDRARAEYAAAWDGRMARSGCRIVIYTHDTNVSRVCAAEMLAEGLHRVDDRITPEIVPLSISKLASMLYTSQCPVAWSGWGADFLHPYALASALLDPRTPLPSALGIDSPELTRLVTEARAHDPGASADPGPYRALHEYTTQNALFLAPPGKIDFMMYRDRWATVGLKNRIPHILDFASFEPRQGTGTPNDQ
ncbi:ABC transporter substrate-binding protein [Streptomyces sp. NBC_01794]|uniref:ABC transporter substrate-binding protein n=1 Tax=Streptomyces sp. NBC_01794 TaxID=2975942 RepID=UPI003087F2B1|nr:ABC transporter substrate-binding protein [Streptomyces sp. NBC_01794]